MKHSLNLRTKQMIKGEKITQKELCKKIEDLCREGKVDRTISQQSISRYLNGFSFPNEDTGKTIELAVNKILGAKKYNLLVKKYRMDELERQNREIQRNKTKTKKAIRISLRKIMNNPNMVKFIQTEEEIYEQEVQQDNYNISLALALYREMPEYIRNYIDVYLWIYVKLPEFVRDVINYSIGITENEIIEFIDSKENVCHPIKYYSSLLNDLKVEERKLLAEVMKGISDAEVNVTFDEITKEILLNRMEDLKEDNIEIKGVTFKESDLDVGEERIAKYIRNKVSDIYEFVRGMYISICMESYDWCLVHNALMYYYFSNEDKNDYLDILKALNYQERE